MAPKAKGQKMGLGEFLTDTTLGDWADEMEDMPLPPSNRSASYGGGFGGGFGSSDRGSSFADRGFSQREQLPLPTKPPFTCHLGNLSFDATEGDIQDLFADCQVTSVRIVEDKLERKPKGFAYVEYASLDGLKKALDMTGMQFQGRNIRVSVAEPQKERSEARVFDDWTRKGPLPPADPPAGRRSSDRFGGGFQRGGSIDAGAEARERGPRRAPFDPNDRTSSAKELSWERRGPPEPVVSAPPPQVPKNLDRPTSNEGGRERKNSPAWGEGRSQDGSRPPRRDFHERPVPVREPTAAEKDNQWRARMRPDVPADQQGQTTSPPPKEKSSPASPRATPPAPAQRPKLNLQKRTVSQAEPSPALPSANSDTSKANPFGAARPVDTLQRDREVEERLRVKREQERKELEEQRAVDAKAKAEAKAGKEKDRAERFGKARDRANGQGKEGEGEENKTRPPKYEILRRAEGGDEESTETGGEDADANGRIPVDQSVKPQEVVVDPNGGADAQTTEQLDEEGWSTVGGGKSKKGRSNAGSRAIAS